MIPRLSGMRTYIHKNKIKHKTLNQNTFALLQRIKPHN